MSSQLPRSDAAAEIGAARGPDARGLSDVGVYVHVPFCERVCPYCDFAVVGVGTLPARREARYVDALLAELVARQPDFAGRTLASLYLGGGTPSLLTPQSVARIVREVCEHIAPTPGRAPEITLEVNPSTVERERLPDFRTAGVSRVSVGIQSFDDGSLKRLGRAHRADEGRATLKACRDAGFERLCLDLIHGAPGQTLGALERDLDEALTFEPDHVSAYELTIEPGTPFEVGAARGQLDLPHEDLAVAMLEACETRLGAAGLRRYEISNYARPGAEAVHNRRYWQRRPVLALGAGAFSTDPPGPGRPFGARLSNPRGERDYLARVEAGTPAAEAEEVFDPATARSEAVFLALRQQDGLSAESFRAEFGAPPRGFYATEIEEMVEAGLLEESRDGNLCLSPKGRLLANHVFAAFAAV